MRSLIRFPPRVKPVAFAVVVALTALSGAGTAVAAPAGAGLSARTAGQKTKVVRYHGYRLVVPAGWPVFNLAADPSVCVRFNRHAVYLGTPGARERCPAHALGRTEAILVSPLAAHGARAGDSNGQVLPPATSRDAQPPQGSSTERAVPSDGVTVTATWSSQPGLVARALDVPSVSATSAATAAAVRPEARAAAVHATGDIYTGPGFDACSTPSASTMSDWGASPYRAVGIYVGGANMACSQTNLTPAWVQQESSAGWTLLPIYVGLQAPNNGCGCAAIVPSQASAQGTAAAQDAINQAEAVGISPGNPIYDDMEAYNRTSTNTSAVLAFLSAWTTELHAQGYVSGVYSSANSGVTDLVDQYGTGYVEPDQIWIADWNNQETTSDPYVPSADWPNHQRLHQYRGGHNATYDGATINIDSDYVDAGGAAGGALFPNGTFVQVSGTTQILRDRRRRAAVGQQLERRGRRADVHGDHPAAVRFAKPGTCRWHVFGDRHRSGVPGRRRRTDVHQRSSRVRIDHAGADRRVGHRQCGQPVVAPEPVPATARSSPPRPARTTGSPAALRSGSPLGRCSGELSHR